MKFRLLICFLGMLLSSVGMRVDAQENNERLKVAGVVVDAAGVPLPGVHVEVNYKGKKTGMVTALNGEFGISTEKGSTLKFSFIGMKTVYRTVHGSELHMKVVMEDESTQLDQVVVMGYTTTTKRRTTGSVATVDAGQLKNIPAARLDLKMQGQIAGVDVKAISGRPGESAKIRIRGENTLTGNQEPLWVVDGVPLERNIPQVDKKDLSSIFTTGIAGVNPNDIENISVLKDASATAIYGSRAAGGVIVVTTKNGKAGKLRVSYSASLNIASAPPRSPHLMNSAEKLAWEKELWNEFSADRFAHQQRYPVIGIYGIAQAGKGIFKTMSQKEKEDYLDALAHRPSTDWFKELFRTSISQGHFISLSGGTQKQTFYLSAGFDDNNGIEKGTYYKRFSFNGKYDVNIGSRTKLGIITDMSVQDTDGSASDENPYYYAYFANPYERAYDEQGNYAPDMTYKSFETYNAVNTALPLPKDGFNILRELNESRSKAKNITSSLKANLAVNLLESLRLEGLASYNYSANYSDINVGKNTYKAFISRPFEKNFNSQRQYGYFYQNYFYNTSYNLRAQLNFHKDFGKHYLSSLLGTEIRGQQTKGISTKRYDYDPKTGIATIPRPQETTAVDYNLLNTYLTQMDGMIGQTDVRSALASFYFSADYAYDQKYIVSLTARTDGSSNFGAKEQFNPTGSLGFSWHVDKEKFFKSLQPLFNSMTLRVAGGYTGNINSSVYPQLILNYNTNERRVTPDGTYPISSIKTPPNPLLRWEKTRDVKFSLETGMLHNRLHLLAEVYDRHTSDVVSYSVIPTTTGFTQQSFNTSTIRNRGVELSVSGTMLNTKNWNMSGYANFSYNENVLVDYNAPNLKIDGGNYVGYPVNSLMSGKLLGIDPLTGLYMFEKRSDSKMLAEKDRQDFTNYLFFRGTKNAPYNGGVGMNLSYKNLSLHIGGNYSIGGKVMNQITPPKGAGDLGSGTSEKVKNERYDVYRNYFNVEKDVTNRWTPEHPVTNGYPRLIDAFGDKLYLDIYTPDGDIVNKAAQIEDVSYFKLSTIMLSYSFDVKSKWMKQLGIHGLGLSFSANNVAILTNYSGMDPETPGATYPMARSYSFGLNVDF